VVDPFTIAIGQVASKMAVRAFLNGTEPSTDDWADAVAELLKAAFEHADDSSNRLDRIEAKIDALANQRYDDAIGSAKLLCRYALASWRAPDERVDLLRQARLELVHAVSAAGTDPGRRAIANFHLAVVHYSLQARDDSKACIRTAYGDALTCLAGHAASASWNASELVLVDQAFKMLMDKARFKGAILTGRELELTQKGAELVANHRFEQVAAAREHEILLGQIVSLQALSGSVPGVCSVQLERPHEHEEPGWAETYSGAWLQFVQHADAGSAYLPEVGLNASIPKVTGADGTILGYLTIHPADRTSTDKFGLLLDASALPNESKAKTVDNKVVDKAIRVAPRKEALQQKHLPKWWLSIKDGLHIWDAGIGSAWVPFQSSDWEASRIAKAENVTLTANLVTYERNRRHTLGADSNFVLAANYNHRIQWRVPNPLRASAATPA
jgi:hypothetical protein